MRSTRNWTAACLLGLLAWGAAARAAETTAADPLTRLAERCLPAYVFIGGGSGAIISPDGFIITNAHVAMGSKRWKVRSADGTYYYARVVGVSPGTDLCLLQIEHAENLACLPLADSDKLQVGDAVIAIGNPFALGNIDGKPTVTLGIVSALHVDRPHAYDAVQTDTPINPGNSGGPLINLQGELVGVNAQIQTRFGLRQNTGIGYAISSNQVKRFLPALKEAEGRALAVGRISGLTLGADPDKPAEVAGVRAESDAAAAGLQKGDTIVAVGKAPVESVREYEGAIGRYPTGTEITLLVRRGDPSQDHKLTVTTAKPGRPYIGVNFDLKDPRSMTVKMVDADSPAAAAGVKPGDVIVGIGNMRLGTRRQYYDLVYRRVLPGMTLPLVVRRGQQNVALQVTVGEED